MMKKFENIDTTKAQLFNIPLSNEKFSENLFDDHKSLNLNAKMPFTYSMDNYSNASTTNNTRTNSNSDINNEDSSVSTLEKNLKLDLSKEIKLIEGDTIKINSFLTKKTYMTKHQVEDEIENLYTTRSCPTGYKESELRSSTVEELLNLRKITFEYLKYRSSKTRNVQFIYLIKRINMELSERKINTNMTMVIPEYAKTNESLNNTINSGEYTLTKKISNNDGDKKLGKDKFEDLYDLSFSGDLWNNITEKKDKEKEKKFVIHTKYFSMKTKGKLQVPQLFQDNGKFERNKYKVSNDSGNINFCGFSNPHEYFDLKNLDKIKKVQEIIINNRQKYSHMTLNTPNYSETLNSSFNKNNDLSLNENNKKFFDINALKNSKFLKEKEKKKLALKKSIELINKLRTHEEMKKKFIKKKDQLKLNNTFSNVQITNTNKTFEFLGFRTIQISKVQYDKIHRKENNIFGRGKGKGKRRSRKLGKHTKNDLNDKIPSTRKIFAKLFKKKKDNKKNINKNIPRFILIKQERVCDGNNKKQDSFPLKIQNNTDYKENILNLDNITIASNQDCNKSDIVMPDKFFPSSQSQRSASTQLPMTSSNDEINSNSDCIEQENFINYNEANNENHNTDQCDYLSSIMKLNNYFDFSCFNNTYNNDQINSSNIENHNSNTINNNDQKNNKNIFISNEIPHIEFANSKETMYH